jgi:hypothetical protein
MIQISDFSVHNLFNLEADKRVETAFYNFSRDSFPAKADVQAFA